MRNIASRFILALLFAICASATSLKAQNFVYTNDSPGGSNQTNTVTGYAVDAAGNLTQIAGSPFSTGGKSAKAQSIASVRALTVRVGNRLFAANDGDGTVSSFSINTSTGVLTLASGSPFVTPFSACNGSYGLTLTAGPDGSFLFVASICGNSIASYSIAANGILTPVSGSPFSDGCTNPINPDIANGINAIKASPDGRYLADVDNTCGIAMFNVTSSGALNPASRSPFAPLGSNSLEIPCSSDYVFSLQLNQDASNNNVSKSVYTAQIGASGSIAELPLPSLGPGLPALSNDDRFLFVSTSDPSGVIVYAVSDGGALALVPGSPFLYSHGETGATEMTISGDGKFLYISSSVSTTGKAIAVFAINSSTGSLTEVAGSPHVSNPSSLSALASYPPKICGPAPLPPPVGNSAVVVVPGTANPYLAGMPNGSPCCSGDVAPDQSPVQVAQLGFTAGNVVWFNVAGSVSFGGGTPTNPPDGTSIYHTPSYDNISGINGPLDALLGVFLNDNQPDITPPPYDLDYSPLGIGLSFTAISPALKEVFFIGDGLAGDGTGSVQRFVVPFGATRLFLGTSDGSGWYNNSGQFNVTVKSSGLPPPITIAPPTLFFTVPQMVGTQSNSMAALVTNNSAGPITLGPLNASAGFSIVTNSVSNNCSTFPLIAGGSCTIGVTITPATTGPINGTVTFRASTPGSPLYTLNLSGTGIPAEPVVSFTPPDGLTFNQVLNVQGTQTVTVTNTGFASLSITATQVLGPFGSSTNCLDFPMVHGQSCHVDVKFTPASVGTVTGSIVFTDNAADSPQSVALTGNGTAVGVPAIGFSSTNLTFPPTVLGTSSLGLLVVTNTGNASLVFAAGSVTLNDITNYSITDGCVAASPLAVGANCVVAVETHPGNSGATPTGTISFADNAAGTPQHVLIGGTGITTCTGNDADGDGLCDDWETNGLFARISGKDVFIDLPAMGADPRHKDIFIQADYMKTADTAKGAHHHDMTLGAEKLMIASFAAAPVTNPDGKPGVNLHVDCGSTCIMDPKTGATWGSASQVQTLVEPVPVGTPPVIPFFGTFNTASPPRYLWTTFDQNSILFKGSGRAFAFHHAIFVHEFTPAFNSGISRNGSNFNAGASDLIVSLGSGVNQVGSDGQQSATLMHELGHNLGLHHGGNEEFNYKPNYLSVMNYMFQFAGLIKKSTDGKSYGGNLDYSRFKLPDLDETNLSETLGLTGGDDITGYGTYYYCPGNDVNAGSSTAILNAYGQIDWNCDKFSNSANNSDINGDFSVDVNGKFVADIKNEVLGSQKDWPVLVYSGGAVGGLGAGFQGPTDTPVNEINLAEASRQVFLNRVEIAHPGIVALPPGGTVNLILIVRNTGQNTDTYNISGSSALGWGTFPSLLPVVTLAGGASAQIQVTINVPAATSLGVTDKIAVAVVSQASPVRDSAEISIVTNAAPNPVTLSVATLSLDTLNVGSTGVATPIIVTNTSGTVLNIASVAASGDFNQTNTCGISLSVGASCVISVRFVPTIPGTRTGAININDGAAGSPHSVQLTGTGTGSFVTLSGGPLNFPSTTPGTQSAQQSVTFTNSGNVPVTISSVAVSGPFVYQAPAIPVIGQCGATVAAGGSCSVGFIMYAPTAPGTQAGILTITDSAISGSQSVNLSGLGADFALPITGNSSATVTKGQTATYTITPAALGGFTGTVILTCAGAPTGAECTMSPKSILIPAAGLAQSFAVTVTTTAASKASLLRLPRGKLPIPNIPVNAIVWFGLLALAMLVVSAARRKRTSWILATLVLGGVLSTSCASKQNATIGGASSGTPAGTSILTVTGTFTQNAVTVTHSANITLVVQ